MLDYTRFYATCLSELNKKNSAKPQIKTCDSALYLFLHFLKNMMLEEVL